VIFWVALRKEFLEQWRSYRLLIVAVVLVFFGLSSPLLARYTPELLKLAIPPDQAGQLLALFPTPTVADAVGQYVKNLSQFGILLALLMTMGTVAQEKDKGTAALMLVKPMPRGIFLLAKFVALGLIFAVSILLAAIACYYYTLLLFGPLNLTAWLALNALLLLMVLVYVALTLLCSTLTSSQVVAAGLAFGLLIVVSGIGALPKVGDYLPGRLTAWGTALVLGAGGTWWPALWVSLGLIVVALLGAWLIFERQEL
jgi:ABC-2 type transport system permease protein